MRLTEKEVVAIKAAAREVFGDDAVIRLFGSRVRDELRGGDIDLHFQVDEGFTAISHAAAFRSRLFKRIPERKIDLVFQTPCAPERPIDRVAHCEGIVS